MLIQWATSSVYPEWTMFHLRPLKNGAAGNRRTAYPARYSALGLLRRGLTAEDWPAAWQPQPMKKSYDVVIIGGGVHGLAAAYYLATNHGITDVAVLDKGYLGSGGSGRNTAILRSNYLTPEGVRFYDRSLTLYQRLSTELDFNVMFSQRGHMTLAHNDSSLRTMRWRAEVNKVEGVDSEVIDPAEVKRLAPLLDVSREARYPILGALWHPPGGIIRHDAVVWGYARGAAAHGVHLHQEAEVTGIDVTNDRVTGVRTTKADIATGLVLNATAGWCSLIAAMAGVRLPVQTSPLQAAVTEPVRPFLRTVIVSGSLHVYISQTDRGELVFGASMWLILRHNLYDLVDDGLESQVEDLKTVIKHITFGVVFGVLLDPLQRGELDVRMEVLQHPHRDHRDRGGHTRHPDRLPAPSSSAAMNASTSPGSTARSRTRAPSHGDVISPRSSHRG